MREFPRQSHKPTYHKTGPSDLELLGGAMSRISKLEKDLTMANRRAQKAELELQFMNRNAHGVMHEQFFLQENKVRSIVLR